MSTNPSNGHRDGCACNPCDLQREEARARRYGPLPPWEVTAERWDDMLNVLPPCKWRHVAGGELFHVSERLSGDVVSWFVRIGARYFELQDEATRPAHEIVSQCYQERVRELEAEGMTTSDAQAVIEAEELQR